MYIHTDHVLEGGYNQGYDSDRHMVISPFLHKLKDSGKEKKESIMAESARPSIHQIASNAAVAREKGCIDEQRAANCSRQGGSVCIPHNVEGIRKNEGSERSAIQAGTDCVQMSTIMLLSCRGKKQESINRSRH